MDGTDARDVDYETPDGSTFSLRAIWASQNGEAVFQYTTISAQVAGQAYTGKLSQYPDEVDDGDVLSALEPVPPECVHPKFPKGFTKFIIEPEDDLLQWYFKAPSFTYDDCRPGRTFVADCVLNEASVLETLKQYPHDNLCSYVGCLVENGYITHLCFRRYPYSLREFSSQGLSDEQRDTILHGVEAAIKHLHSLGLAHNDVNIDNICVLHSGEPVLVDFDGCLPFGEELLKGVDFDATSDSEPHLSRASNDLRGLSLIEQSLRENNTHNSH